MLIIITLIFIVVLFYGSKLYWSFSQDDNSGPTQIPVNITFEDSPFDLSHAEYVVLDCETTGLINFRADQSDLRSFPYVVQISWAIFDINGCCIKFKTYIIKPTIKIPIEASNIHRITTAIAKEKGVEPLKVFAELIEDITNVKTVVAHNIDFDIPILEAEFIRNGFDKQFESKDKICTMKSSVSYCKIPKQSGGYKYPKLPELYGVLFANTYKVSIVEAHSSEVDTVLTAKCFFELKSRINLTVIKGYKKSDSKKMISEAKSNKIEVYDDYIQKPEFKRIFRNNCPDLALIDKYDIYKKHIIKDWNLLYENEKIKLNIPQDDRQLHKIRLDKYLEEMPLLTEKINSYSNKLSKQVIIPPSDSVTQA
jgi:DNA polymerase-3 subunit epsilon